MVNATVTGSEAAHRCSATVVLEDITAEQIDVIVNTANTSLRGDGVDGAIL
jgi:O-acetyl-ADP-ribose deacetylase (regulator of RNase III)